VAVADGDVGDPFAGAVAGGWLDGVSIIWGYRGRGMSGLVVDAKGRGAA
jgi:hypothetical protein